MQCCTALSNSCRRNWIKPLLKHFLASRPQCQNIFVVRSNSIVKDLPSQHYFRNELQAWNMNQKYLCLKWSWQRKKKVTSWLCIICKYLKGHMKAVHMQGCPTEWSNCVTYIIRSRVLQKPAGGTKVPTTQHPPWCTFLNTTCSMALNLYLKNTHVIEVSSLYWLRCSQRES